MTTPASNSNSNRISVSARTAARRLALSTAVAASAVALGGCSMLGLGGAHQDKAELARVEETINRARGTPDTARDSADYAKDVDAALTRQPALVAKIENVKAGRDPSARLPEAKPAEEPKSTSPQVVLASHTDNSADKAPPKVETKVEPKAAAKAETPVAAPTPEPVKATVSAAAVGTTAVVPLASEKPAAEAKVSEPKVAEPKTTEAKADLPEAMKNAVAVATMDPATKGITAMGSMNAAAAVAELAAAAPAVETLSMDTIVKELRKQVSTNPRQLNLALALQLLENDAKAPDEALAALSEADQKIVADVTAAVGSIMQQPAGTPSSLVERARPLVAAGHKWEGEGDLNLPRLVLASRVDSYGVFSQVEPKFENGKRHTVIIYCEVANFATRKGDDGWYTTKLAQQDSLITEDGLLVWRPNPEEVEDRSRNQRRDFYLVKKLSLPETLAIGKYTLRMSVTDKQTNKISMVSLPVEVVAR